jgi:hypothetical protein
MDDDIQLQRAPDGVAVTVGGQLIHTAGSEEEARQLAQWIQYQLAEGRSLDDVARMLRGEPPADAEADLTVLDGTIGDLRAALDTGALDSQLDALLEAEREGKARSGALDALQKRLDADA